MSWSVDEIELVPFPVHPYGTKLDGNSSFLFDIHSVEHLSVRHISMLDSSRDLEESVSKGRFPVIDMGDNAEIADVFHSNGKRTCPSLRRMKQSGRQLISVFQERVYMKTARNILLAWYFRLRIIIISSSFNDELYTPLPRLLVRKLLPPQLLMDNQILIYHSMKQYFQDILNPHLRVDSTHSTL